MKSQGYGNVTYERRIIELNLYIILEVMEQQNVTRTELAEAIGISTYTLRTRFKKETSFTIDEVIAIKKKLNLSIETINDIFFKKEVA